MLSYNERLKLEIFRRDAALVRMNCSGSTAAAVATAKLDQTGVPETSVVINDLDRQLAKNLEDTKTATIIRTVIRTTLRTIVTQKAKGEMKTSSPIGNLLLNLGADLLEAMASCRRVVPYLDLPLQHAHPGILRSMKRGGGHAQFLKLLAKARSAVPGLAIRSTFIVGYPGEKREHFEALCDFLAEARLGAYYKQPDDYAVVARLKGRDLCGWRWRW